MIITRTTNHSLTPIACLGKQTGESTISQKVRNVTQKFFDLFKSNKSPINPIELSKNGTSLGFVNQMTPEDYGIQEGKTYNTPIHWAIANAHNEVANEMIKQGPPFKKGGTFWLDSRCSRGNTPLHLAIGKGYKDKSRDEEPLTISNETLARKMLQKGANPNIQNNHGDTPLHLACARRDAPMIQSLLNFGARTDIKNANGQTPRDLLNLSYDEAEKLIERTVIVFLLNKNEFDRSDSLKSLLDNPLAEWDIVEPF